MSLSTNASRGPINHLATTLVRLLQDQIPALGRGVIVTERIINQVKEIVRKNLHLLGSAVVTAGLIALLPSLLVTAVHVLGFTAAGVLKGSLAAAIQSLMYGASAGGWFSVFQAFGATAVISPTGVIVGVTLVVVGAGVFGYIRWRKWYNEKQRDDSILGPDKQDSSSLQVAKKQRNFWDFFN